MWVLEKRQIWDQSSCPTLYTIPCKFWFIVIWFDFFFLVKYDLNLCTLVIKSCFTWTSTAIVAPFSILCTECPSNLSIWSLFHPEFCREVTDNQMPQVAPVILPEMYKIFTQAEVCTVHRLFQKYMYVWELITYMKKLLDSDWLRAVQLKSNTSAKSVIPVQKA